MENPEGGKTEKEVDMMMIVQSATGVDLDAIDDLSLLTEEQLQKVQTKVKGLVKKFKEKNKEKEPTLDDLKKQEKKEKKDSSDKSKKLW
jgi:hypothetical protein